jgi:hypothetical protein
MAVTAKLQTPKYKAITYQNFGNFLEETALKPCNKQQTKYSLTHT